MANGWWGSWRPSLPAHTGDLQATDLIECTSIVGGLPVNTAITGTQIINAASGGGGGALYMSSTVTTVTGTTAETLIASVPIPTTITNAIIRASFIVRVTTLAGAPRTRIRIGTIATPTSAQLAGQTQLGTNAVGSASMVSMYRTMPVIGGALGSIKSIASGSNVNADYGQIAAFTVTAKDFTTQQYLYFTIYNNNVAAVTECYGLLVENIQ